LSEPLRCLQTTLFSKRRPRSTAIQMLERWPNEWLPGWVETMTSVARDEAGSPRAGHANPDPARRASGTRP